MHTVWKNICNLFQNQRRFAVLILFTQMMGAFSICFTVGVLYNNRYIVLEDQYQSLQINLGFGVDGTEISYDELEDTMIQVLEILKYKEPALEISHLFFAEDGSFLAVYSCGIWSKNAYHPAPSLESIFAYQIFSGRNFTEEDFQQGALVALATSNYPESTITLEGKIYDIIGWRSKEMAEETMYCVVYIPISSWHSLGVQNASIEMGLIPSYKEYQQICKILDQKFAGRYIISDYYAASADFAALYRTIAMAVVGILLAVTGCLMMLYSYIMEKRKYRLTIFRLSGCSRSRCIQMYLQEIVFLACPSCVAGVLLFIGMQKGWLERFYPYMASEMTLNRYLLCGGVLFLGILLEGLILSWLKTSASIKTTLGEETL